MKWYLRHVRGAETAAEELVSLIKPFSALFYPTLAKELGPPDMGFEPWRAWTFGCVLGFIAIYKTSVRMHLLGTN